MSVVDLSYPAAFGGGMLSFLSPCVLPLVPAYLCFLGGVSLEQLTGEDGEGAPVAGRVMQAALAFVLIIPASSFRPGSPDRGASVISSHV